MNKNNETTNVMEALANPMLVIILQYINMSNQHGICFKLT